MNKIIIALIFTLMSMSSVSFADGHSGKISLAGFFVGDTGHTPLGREIHQHGLAIFLCSGDRLRRPSVPLDSTGKILQHAG